MLRRHRVAHLRIWTVLAVLLPLLAIAAVALRNTAPSETPPVRITP